LDTTGKKILFKLGKNPFQQNQYFKLENCKNQVQIDRGPGLGRNKQKICLKKALLNQLFKNFYPKIDSKT
jgi:hypothetical protein